MPPSESSPPGTGSSDLETVEDSGQSYEPRQQFPVVAVGASAGGLEAFTDRLRHLPADTGSRWSTRSRRVEEELRQSQKMEAIGYLAAGVAHDFNNLLTGIMRNACLLLRAMPENDPRRSALESVVSGAQHAADLTRQLLAYAGKGRFYLERVDLSEVVTQTGRLIHASIPASVQLRLDLDKHLPLLLADPAQMQQVVMNLMINGAEAIGDAGGAVADRRRGD